MKLLTTSVVLCIGLISATTANAALVGSADGQTVYDTDRNITWLSNANLAASNTFGVSGIAVDGTMTWNTAQSWVGAMNAANYLGYHDWRLPITFQPDATCSNQSGGYISGYDCTGSEMGHLFYNELSGIAGQSITTTHNANYNLFQNVQSSYYWSSTEFAPDTSMSWGINFFYGGQYALSKDTPLFAWAVRPGDVTAVPVPATFWLLGSGLIGLVGVARKRKAAQ